MSGRSDELVWYHTIDLADGSSTPGVFDCRPVAARISWPRSLAGGRCLDVGTMDGFWAFEMECRGASEVLAIDVLDPRKRDLWVPARAEPKGSSLGRPRPTFEQARRERGSAVRWLDCSVYDLDPVEHGLFDVVFLGTLLVHLRDPIAALRIVRSVCASEIVLVECLDPLLDLIARPWALARFAMLPDQWWRFNAAAVRRLLQIAGFEVAWVSKRFVTPLGPASPRRPLLRSLLRQVGERRLPSCYAFRRGAVEVAIRARPCSIVSAIRA